MVRKYAWGWLVLVAIGGSAAGQTAGTGTAGTGSATTGTPTTIGNPTALPPGGANVGSATTPGITPGVSSGSTQNTTNANVGTPGLPDPVSGAVPAPGTAVPGANANTGINTTNRLRSPGLNGTRFNANLDPSLNPRIDPRQNDASVDPRGFDASTGRMFNGRNSVGSGRTFGSLNPNGTTFGRTGTANQGLGQGAGRDPGLQPSGALRGGANNARGSNSSAFRPAAPLVGGPNRPAVQGDAGTAGGNAIGNGTGTVNGATGTVDAVEIPTGGAGVVTNSAGVGLANGGIGVGTAGNVNGTIGTGGISGGITVSGGVPAGSLNPEIGSTTGNNLPQGSISTTGGFSRPVTMADIANTYQPQFYRGVWWNRAGNGWVYYQNGAWRWYP